MNILLFLFILFGSAVTFGEIFEKMDFPAPIGEVFGGLIVGIILVLIGGLSPEIGFYDETNAIVKVGEAIVAILIGAGIDIQEIRDHEKESMIIALFGIIFCLISGGVLGYIFGLTIMEALFIGSSLAISATYINVPLLDSLGRLRTKSGFSLIEAAVIDDVVGILMLSSMIFILEHPQEPILIDIGIISVEFIIFFILMYIFESYVFDWILEGQINQIYRLSLVILFGLGFSYLSEFLGFHIILGAFLYGILLRRVLKSHDVERLTSWGFAFFAPLHFGWIGFNVSFEALFTYFMLGLLILAFIGKIGGCSIGSFLSGFSLRDSLFIGIGMNGRGVVELFFVYAALSAGLINDLIYSSIVFMALITSLTTPLLLSELSDYW